MKREIRCQFVILARKDEPTPDYARHRITPKTSGLIAWLLWLFVHIIFLIGFRNRLVVMIQWAWSYAAV